MIDWKEKENKSSSGRISRNNHKKYVSMPAVLLESEHRQSDAFIYNSKLDLQKSLDSLASLISV